MNELAVVEHCNERVLTTSQIAELYGSTPKRITENFTRNREWYTVGKHYHYLEGEALREFVLHTALSGVQNLKVRALYLWTEKGALLIAKSLDTPQAWEVYQRLVDDYYRAKAMLAQQPAQPQIMTTEDMIIAMAQSAKETKARLAAVEQLANEQMQRVESVTEQMQHTQARLDVFDRLDTVGDEQQRLVLAVRKYAALAGVAYDVAWGEFVREFNTAYRTNVRSLIRHTGRKMTTPQYLAAVGRLPDGLRVADKMLRPYGAGVEAVEAVEPVAVEPVAEPEPVAPALTLVPQQPTDRQTALLAALDPLFRSAKPTKPKQPKQPKQPKNDGQLRMF